MANGLLVLKSALTDCGGSKSEIEKLINAMKQLSSPEELIFVAGINLIVNRHEIYKQVKDIQASWHANSFN